jgi:hypothetical protein
MEHRDFVVFFLEINPWDGDLMMLMLGNIHNPLVATFNWDWWFQPKESLPKNWDIIVHVENSKQVWIILIIYRQNARTLHVWSWAIKGGDWPQKISDWNQSNNSRWWFLFTSGPQQDEGYWNRVRLKVFSSHWLNDWFTNYINPWQSHLAREKYSSSCKSQAAYTYK